MFSLRPVDNRANSLPIKLSILDRIHINWYYNFVIGAVAEGSNEVFVNVEEVTLNSWNIVDCFLLHIVGMYHRLHRWRDQEIIQTWLQIVFPNSIGLILTQFIWLDLIELTHFPFAAKE